MLIPFLDNILKEHPYALLDFTFFENIYLLSFLVLFPVPTFLETIRQSLKKYHQTLFEPYFSSKERNSEILPGFLSNLFNLGIQIFALIGGLFILLIVLTIASIIDFFSPFYESYQKPSSTLSSIYRHWFISIPSTLFLVVLAPAFTLIALTSTAIDTLLTFMTLPINWLIKIPFRSYLTAKHADIPLEHARKIRASMIDLYEIDRNHSSFLQSTAHAWFNRVPKNQSVSLLHYAVSKKYEPEELSIKLQQLKIKEIHEFLTEPQDPTLKETHTKKFELKEILHDSDLQFDYENYEHPTKIDRKKANQLYEEIFKEKEPLQSDIDHYIALISPGTALRIKNDALFSSLVNNTEHLIYLSNTIKNEIARDSIQTNAYAILTTCVNATSSELPHQIPKLKTYLTNIQNTLADPTIPDSVFRNAQYCLLAMSISLLLITLLFTLMLANAITFLSISTSALVLSISAPVTTFSCVVTHSFFKQYPNYEKTTNQVEEAINQIEATVSAKPIT